MKFAEAHRNAGFARPPLTAAASVSSQAHSLASWRSEKGVSVLTALTCRDAVHPVPGPDVLKLTAAGLRSSVRAPVIDFDRSCDPLFR